MIYHTLNLYKFLKFCINLIGYGQPGIFKAGGAEYF
jgi:hypothetical protein